MNIFWKMNSLFWGILALYSVSRGLFDLPIIPFFPAILLLEFQMLLLAIRWGDLERKKA